MTPMRRHRKIASLQIGSLLRRYVAPMVPSVEPPAPVLVEGELEYIVEKILDSRVSRRKLQYLVLSDLESLEAENDRSDSPLVPTHLHRRSRTFPPLSACPSVEIFVKLVGKEIERLNTVFDHDNLTPPLRRAVKELSNMQDVVIKQADKGGNVVIWPTSLYEAEAFRQLQRPEHYRKLDTIPLSIFQQKLKSLLDEGRCVETLPSFVKDTTDVLRRLDGLALEDDTWLVTCDVESLYTSIDHSHGMRAAKFFLNMTNLGPELINFILELLGFVLTHNFFVFKDRPFLQLQGTAMGASCAPSYANLFLGLWERDVVLDTPGHSSVVSWLRYIDDILFIWQGSTSQLETFLNRLNINPLNIRLTWKSPDGTLATDVFRKSTATNSLLHFSSSHPPKLKSSIPIGQFLRARRICSDDDTFSRQAGELTRRFRNRGYRHADIQRGHSRALYSDRSSLLAGPTRRPLVNTDSAPRFITQFNSNWSEISEILNRHWPVLLTDKDLSRQLTPHPLITWRRSRTLRDVLCKSHYIPLKATPLVSPGRVPLGVVFHAGIALLVSISPELKNLRTRLGIKHIRLYTILHVTQKP
ncbi:unnamed protein product [Ranitomeya imitator]|uniref:Helix-turn-helix domain-containing protein n=1 Tax=Ranitomeya imitator TaxID=111125 RepID=A0ABN9MRR0_9NEOB|nr:unnamed protein product [Ranitomeya imitator]